MKKLLAILFICMFAAVSFADELQQTYEFEDQNSKVVFDTESEDTQEEEPEIGCE